MLSRIYGILDYLPYYATYILHFTPSPLQGSAGQTTFPLFTINTAKYG